MSRESRVQAAEALSALPAPLMAEMVRQAEAGYPSEICGMVIGQPGVPCTYRVRQVANIADREPQADVGGQLRDARTAYKMDPLGQLHVLREADEHGWNVLLLYHSHPDHEAYFSRMDKDRALAANGEPMWPGAVYVVISVMGGRARGAASFVWDAPYRDFVGTSVRLPGSP